MSYYDVHLHVAIASLRVIDTTRPRNTEGRKALDLLAGKGKKICALCESMIHAQPATCADFFMHAGVFCQNCEGTLAILVLCDSIQCNAA